MSQAIPYLRVDLWSGSLIMLIWIIAFIIIITIFLIYLFILNYESVKNTDLLKFLRRNFTLFYNTVYFNNVVSFFQWN